MLWVKAFHIIAVVTWFSGIFYLPRLFVYHASCDDIASSERFKVMERKLYRGIMWPSMLAVIGLGIWLLSYSWGYYINALWLQIKLAFILALIIYHLYCGHLIKLFKQDKNPHTHVFYRWFNEIPVFILIPVVILVVVKPF